MHPTLALDSGTEQARRVIYDRARTVIAAAGLSSAQVRDEQSALETAIERIEAETQQPTGLRRSLSLNIATIEAPLGESAPNL